MNINKNSKKLREVYNEAWSKCVATEYGSGPYNSAVVEDKSWEAVRLHILGEHDPVLEEMTGYLREVRRLSRALPGATKIRNRLNMKQEELMKNAIRRMEYELRLASCKREMKRLEAIYQVLFPKPANKPEL